MNQNRRCREVGEGEERDEVGREECRDLYSQSREFLRKEESGSRGWGVGREEECPRGGLALRTCGVDRQVYSRAIRTDF